MSIGRRFIDLARAELNALLDRASRLDDDPDGPDPDEDLYRRYGLDELSDAELEAELERRRQRREAAARATRARVDEEARRASTPPPPSRPPTGGDEIRRAYAALEVPYGSDFATVRKSYRLLMRKYHPDRHSQSPEKQKAANELAQRLTQAYTVLGKHLKR